jgi:hypothetical protein
MSGPPDTAYSNLADLAPDDVQGCRCLYGLPANVSEGYICSLPSKIDYGTVNVGSSSERQLDVTNTGTAALIMGSIQMQGGDFALTANQCAFGMALQPGATCRFTVAAIPTVADRRQAEVILNTSAGPYRIPLSVQGAVAPLPPLNFEGAWWNSPAGLGRRLGLTLAHQDDVIFATWFTYDASHHATWMSMSAFRVGSSNTFSGTLVPNGRSPAGCGAFRCRSGSAHPGGCGNARVQRCRSRNVPVPGEQRRPGATDRSPRVRLASDVRVRRSEQSRRVDQLPGQLVGSERPGVRVGHLFHPPGRQHLRELVYLRSRWLADVALGDGARTSNGVYHGDVIRTTGPPFNTLPFPSQEVGRTTIGALTLTFANGNNASFAYSVVLGTRRWAFRARSS